MLPSPAVTRSSTWVVTAVERSSTVRSSAQLIARRLRAILRVCEVSIVFASVRKQIIGIFEWGRREGGRERIMNQWRHEIHHVPKSGAYPSCSYNRLPRKARQVIVRRSGSVCRPPNTAEYPPPSPKLDGFRSGLGHLAQWERSRWSRCVSSSAPGCGVSSSKCITIRGISIYQRNQYGQS